MLGGDNIFKFVLLHMYFDENVEGCSQKYLKFNQGGGKNCVFREGSENV